MALTEQEQAELDDLNKRIKSYEAGRTESYLEEVKRAGVGVLRGGGAVLRATPEIASTALKLLNPFGPTIDPKSMIRKEGPNARIENNLTEAAKTAAEMATPENVVGTMGAEAGRRIGGQIGETVGGYVPGGPLTKAIASKTGRYIGETGGAIAGAYAGGYTARGATDVLFGYIPKTNEQLDQWFHDLHENGRGQAVAETIGQASRPVMAAGRFGYAQLQRLEKSNAPLDIKAIAAWTHENFKRAYQGIMEDSAKSMQDKRLQQGIGETINPEDAQRNIAMSGMTVPQKMNSSFMDLLQGVSAGSMAGAGTMRQFGQTTDDLSRAVALQIGMDVGPRIDPADLRTVIEQQIGGEFKKGLAKGQALDVGQYVANVLGNDLLHQVPEGGMMKVYKNVVSMDPKFGKRFDWLSNVAGTKIDFETYRQYRDELRQIITGPASDAYKGEASRLLKLLDKSAEKQMPAAAVDTLRTIQKAESGQFSDDMRINFIKGILMSSDNPRKWIDSMVTKPDYKKITLLLNLIPDPEVQGSLRRAVVDKLMGSAMLPGGRLSSGALRKGIEDTVGPKALEEITSKKTVDDIDKFIQLRQHLEQYKKRGELGGVAIRLTQFTQLLGGLGAIASTVGSTGALGETADQYSGPGLAAASLLLLGPVFAAKAITSPYVNQYLKYAKLAQNPARNEGRMAELGRRLFQLSGDSQLAEHLFGRVANTRWGTQPGDKEAEQYIQQKYGVQQDFQPGQQRYPTGMELGR